MSRRRSSGTLEERYARRRPWRVHVHEIGPNYSYRDEESARARARDLVAPGPDRYAHVTVWECRLDDVWPMRRTVYSYAGPTRHEILERDDLRAGGRGWHLERLED